jgi:imidazolonepropionase-like amidohydrolase
MKPARLSLILLSVALPLAAGSDDSFLLRGATVHPVSGPDIPNGSLLVKDGRIAEIGVKVAAPKGVRIIDVKGFDVYPGMIDSATALGATEISSVRETTDTTDAGAFKPQLRIAIAVNPESEHIPVTRANGITSAIVRPTGGIIAGQAALIHLDGWTTEEMMIKPSAAMQMEFPVIQAVAARGGARAGGPTPFAEARRRYEQQLRELDEFFESARRYQRAKAAQAADFKTDLKLEAMLPVLEGRLPVLVHAEKERAIRAAIEFCEKQKVRMILQQAPEAWKVAADLKAKNIPVTLPRTLSLPEDEDDPYDRAFITPADLFKAGVKFAFCTYGPETSTNPFNLPYEAAAAVPFGLPRQEALKAVTLYAAEIWGVADQIGSLDKGKWADLIVTTGDPLEIPTQVKQVFIKGRAVDLNNKHKRLYEKYSNRP